MLQQRRFTRGALLAALSGLALLTAPAARAEFLTNFTGNSTERNAGTTAASLKIDGTYNFAVLDRTTGGTAGNVFGAVSDYSKPVNTPGRYAGNFDSKFIAGMGSGSLDTSARYLYLVQIVNNGTNATAIKQVLTFLDKTLVTSFGSFWNGSTGIGSGDNRGVVDFANNLGPDNTPFIFNAPADTMTGPHAPPGQPSPPKPFVSSLSRTDPGIQPVKVTLTADALKVTFDTEPSSSSELAANHRSVLIGFTSNYAPSFSINQMFDKLNGGDFSQGHDPIPAPEPPAVILVGVGLACLLVVSRRRKLTVAPATV